MGVAILTAADGFVITMLAMMLLSLCTIALLILCIRRNAARRDLMVEELLREVAEEEKQGKRAPAATEDPKPAEPWEREADWWKKPGSTRPAKKKQ